MAVASIMKGVMYMNFKNSGWSESYYLKETTYASAIPVFEKMTKLRTTFFGTGVAVVWSRVSLEGLDPVTGKNMKDAVGCDIDYPLGPHPRAVDSTHLTPPEDPWTALMMRVETANGKWINRFIRGCPDERLSDLTASGFTSISLSPLPIGQAPYNPDGAATLQNLQRSFWSMVRDSTYHVKPVLPASFETTGFARLIFVRVGKKNTGRPFGMFRGRAQAHLVS